MACGDDSSGPRKYHFGILGLAVCTLLVWFIRSDSSSVGDKDDEEEVLRRYQALVVSSSAASTHRPAGQDRRLFKSRELVLLTLSYHAAPIYDLVEQLAPFGVRVVERGLNSYACRYFNTCKQTDPLKGIRGELIHFGVNQATIKAFASTYNQDPDWKSVDAFVCLYPAATCELFAPFNKTIIVLTTGRYDYGRETLSAWKQWNKILTQIAADSRNIVASSNRFDAEYTRYFTGVMPQLLPSRCRYTDTVYNPTRPGFLLGVRRDWKFKEFFLLELNAACERMNVSVQLTPIRDLYPTYKWTDLASHRGIVPLPHQPSSITILEQYRMNIPLFLPSKTLLLDFQLGKTMMLDEIYSHTETGETLPAHSAAPPEAPNPNVHLASSMHYWLSLCDWYTSTLPHVILYHSVDDLVVKLNSTSLQQLVDVSRLMAEHNEQVAVTLSTQWKEILIKVAADSPNKPH